MIAVLGVGVMLAASAFGMTACGGENNDTPGGEIDATGNTVVKIMFHVDAKSTEGLAYKKRIDEFNAQYADRKIKASASYVARTSGTASYEQQLIGMQNEGSLPDVITFDSPNCASYANSDLLVDIGSYVSDTSDFLSTNTYQGKLYGLPIQESSAGFYYNKKLFQNAGIDVSGYSVDNPWTFEQFQEVCAALKNSGVTAVDMRLDATRDETATYLLYPFIYAAGGDLLSSDGLTATGHLDSAASVKGFSFLKSLVTSGYTGYDIGATDFFTGKVGMYLSSGWTIPDLDNKYPDVFKSRDDWGLLPYPKDVKQASATGSWSFGITNNNHTDKTAAVELLKFLTSTESAKSITDATGMIPARKSVETSYAAGSPEDVLLSQLKKAGTPRPATVGYPDFSDAFNSIIYQIKDNDVATVLTNNAKSLQTKLDRLK